LSEKSDEIINMKTEEFSMYEYKNEDERYFNTTNFYLSCFLVAKGSQLVNISKLDSKKAVFVFVNSPEVEASIHSFSFAKDYSEEAQVDARRFISAIKTLKDSMYQIV
jgi:hypothetical protein